MNVNYKWIHQFWRENKGSSHENHPRENCSYEAGKSTEARKFLAANLLSKLANIGSLPNMLPKEVAGADVNEAKVSDDPVGDGAFAGPGCPDDQGAETLAIAQALKSRTNHFKNSFNA